MTKPVWSKAGWYRGGFTLIELLVVVTIIAILASLLLPMLARARFQARFAVCISNQKQQAVAIISYADDYEGMYPAVTPLYYSGTGQYIPGDDHPWGTAQQKILWPYLGIEFDTTKHWRFNHAVHIDSVMQDPQGMAEVGWFPEPSGHYHSHPGRSFYNWYFDTWGGMTSLGDMRNGNNYHRMMRKIGETFQTGTASSGSYRHLEFRVIASDVFKKMGMAHSAGKPQTISTNHIWGGNRVYVNDNKGDGHFSYGPLYWGSSTGVSFSAFTFDDGHVETFNNITLPQMNTSTLKTASGTASGGWNMPLDYAENR